MEDQFMLCRSGCVPNNPLCQCLEDVINQKGSQENLVFILGIMSLLILFIYCVSPKILKICEDASNFRLWC